MKLSSQSGEKPLWSQLYDILESRILNGEYSEGEILPSEMSLMDEFEVSRVTVRQAMDKLINAKMISRKRGKGTIVLKRESSVATLFQSSFHGVREENNVDDRRVINVEYAVAPIDVAYFFDVPAETPILKLIRQTFIDGRPVTHYETYINPSIPLDDTVDYTGSVYKKLEDVGYPITHVKENISASITTAKEKELFHLSKNDALVNRVRLGSSKNYPVEYTYSKYVASGYKLTIELQ